MSGGGTGVEDTYAQDKYADINRQIYEDYKKRYQPIEDDAISYIQDKNLNKTEAVDRSMAFMDKSMSNAKEAMGRKTARTGGMTAEQRKASDKSMRLSGTAAKVHTANTVRQREDDRVMKLSGDLVNLGRGKEGQTLSGFGTAAELEQRRNSTNKQLKAQDRASKAQLAGTLAIAAASL